MSLRPATQAAAARRVRTLATRLTKGEKKHTKRIAQVAAVYTIAPFVRSAEDIIRDLRRGGADALRLAGSATSSDQKRHDSPSYSH